MSICIYIRTFETGQIAHAAVCVCKHCTCFEVRTSKKAALCKSQRCNWPTSVAHGPYFFKAVSTSDLQRDHRHSSAPLRGTRLIGQEPRETGKSPRNFSDKQHWTTWQSSRTVPWVQYSGCIIDVWWDIHCFDIFGLQYRDHMFLPEIAVVIPPSQLT